MPPERSNGVPSCPPSQGQAPPKGSLPLTALTDQAHSVEQNARERRKFIQNSKILEFGLNCRALWKQPTQRYEKLEVHGKSKPMFTGRRVNSLGQALVRPVSKPHCGTLGRTTGRFQFGQLLPDSSSPSPFLNPPPMP